MAVEVVPYSEDWPAQFERVAVILRSALTGVPGASVEHVGSTSVPGLAAKPIIDIDVLVEPQQVPSAVTALHTIGYVHRGDLGVTGREAFGAPDEDPPRHVYVCENGTLNVRNHLAVREVLRRRPDLRDEYAAVKLALAADPDMDLDTYIAGKSRVLQKVLAESALTDDERALIWRLNDPAVGDPASSSGPADDRARGPRVGVSNSDAEAFTALYGAWSTRTPDDVATLFKGYPGIWWIAGGWALEAFTGVTRRHGDIDPSVLRRDLPALRRHLAGRLHLWTATSGALAPLLPGDDPEGAAEQVLPEGCGQLWTRRSAADPWEYDVLLAPGSAEEWVYKRDPSIAMPMSRALWHAGDVAYLQPEIQLLYKAPGLRAKDQADFETTLPHLDERRRAWLREALARSLPGHPWIGVLSQPRPAGSDGGDG